MIFGSVCSGIEAASVAWSPLGWEASFFSEIDPFPRAVLAHHYPETPCHGDFTTIKGGDYRAIDVLVGGTPCQSFSLAGLRAGLDDPRGNLMLEFGSLARRLGARWLVWENVPGVLSSNKGRDFGAFLGMLAELGYGFAYRVLDAQYFGVPQRRRRVFVVGYLGDWRRPAAVLFERHSLQGHPTPSRKAGAPVAALTASSVGTCGADDNQAQAGHLISGAVTSKWAKGTVGPSGDECQNLISRDVAPTLQAGGNDTGGNDTGGNRPPGTTVDTADMLIVAHTLRGDGFDASEDGTGRGTPIIPVAAIPILECGARTGKSTDDLRAGIGIGDPMYTLQAGKQHAVAFDMRGRDGGAQFEGPHDTANIRAASGGSSRSYVAEQHVRRLTPRECERLQGFPDDYTLVPYRGKPAADGPRYKGLGNSMAVPVMRWLGERIAQVDAIPHIREAAE